MKGNYETKLNDNLKNKIDKLSKEELQKIVDEVENQNLKGPTVKEYFERLQSQSFAIR